MKRRNKNIVYEFDNVSRVKEAIERLEKEYRSEITDFAYMQVPVEEAIFKEMTHREIMMKLHEGSFNPRRGPLIRGAKVKQHIIAFRVKKDEKFDEINKLLWSSGGCKSDKNSGWYKSKSRRIHHIVTTSSELKKTMKRLIGNEELSPVKGFGA